MYCPLLMLREKRDSRLDSSRSDLPFNLGSSPFHTRIGLDRPTQVRPLLMLSDGPSHGVKRLECGGPQSERTLGVRHAGHRFLSVVESLVDDEHVVEHLHNQTVRGRLDEHGER